MPRCPAESPGRRTILIVDDDPECLSFLGKPHTLAGMEDALDQSLGQAPGP